jgi:hypothetical protein
MKQIIEVINTNIDVDIASLIESMELSEKCQIVHDPASKVIYLRDYKNYHVILEMFLDASREHDYIQVNLIVQDIEYLGKSSEESNYMKLEISDGEFSKSLHYSEQTIEKKTLYDIIYSEGMRGDELTRTVNKIYEHLHFSKNHSSGSALDDFDDILSENLL